MRVLGVDFGTRRIGLAISDPSATLARPLMALQLKTAGDAVDRVLAEVARLQADEDGLATIVVGMPGRLDGTPSAQTGQVVAFMAALQARTAVPVVAEDERLTSREAESRLAVTERDWRSRKKHLDATAAAIFLQDYLDRS